MMYECKPEKKGVLMASLYFIHCDGCHEMADCLPHEDEFFCVGGDDEEGCYNRILDAQDALRREERLDKCEAAIRASQEATPAYDSLGRLDDPTRKD